MYYTFLLGRISKKRNLMKKYHVLFTVVMLLALSLLLLLGCGGDSATFAGVPTGVTITIPPGL
jgi:hypothetical protein